jgi:1-phosphofructokinase
MDKTAQAPGFAIDAVTRITELRQDPGGKGINVSKVIAKLGGTSTPIAILAGNTGRAIKQMLSEQGIEVIAFEVEGETRTNLKVIDPVGDTHTDINEPGPEVTQETLDAMLQRLIGMVKPGDIVVMSGSLPKGAPADTYKAWAIALKDAGTKVFLDVDGDKLVAGLEAKPYLVKPNEIELGAILGKTLDTDAKVAEAARSLVADGIDHVVVSMGGAGAVFATADRVVRGISPKVKVGSTVGAGDSVVAALAYAEERGLSLEDTVRLSMATGSANVMESGTQAAERSVVDSLIDKVEIVEL